MKHRTLILVVVIASLALIADLPLSARGPGGGGRGGGGGGGRGGGGGGRAAPAASRSPAASGGARAASRPASRPATGAARPATGAGTARPGTGTARPGTGTARPGVAAGTGRPSAGQLNQFLDVPKASTGAVAGGARPGAGGAAADFLQKGGGAAAARPAAGVAATRPGAGAAATRPGTARPGTAAGQGRQNVAQNRGGRIENRQEWQQNRGQRANEVRNQCSNTPVRDFWSGHPVWGAWAITRPFRWATWDVLDDWVGYGAEPLYYNYGESTYYQDGAVYSGDQQVATEEEYAQQAEELAASAPETSPESMKWMPLGVFALTEDGQAAGAQPTLYMQLVISKEGVISGTFDNKTSGETQTLEGMVDKASQRAAWGVEGKQRPIIETGISNLTQDSAPALIHFADGTTQQWLLVRLEDPEGSK